MKHERKVMAAFASVALLHGCGSGGDFFETTVRNESTRQQTPPGTCGTYGQPVECQPLRPDFSLEDYGVRSVGAPAK